MGIAIQVYYWLNPITTVVHGMSLGGWWLCLFLYLHINEERDYFANNWKILGISYSCISVFLINIEDNNLIGVSNIVRSLHFKYCVTNSDRTGFLH